MQWAAGYPCFQLIQGVSCLHRCGDRKMQANKTMKNYVPQKHAKKMMAGVQHAGEHIRLHRDGDDDDIMAMVVVSLPLDPSKGGDVHCTPEDSMVWRQQFHSYCLANTLLIQCREPSSKPAYPSILSLWSSLILVAPIP